MTSACGAPLNLLDPDLYAGDPSPAYRWLRDEAPVYWDPVNGIWGISRHADVLSVERDPARYSSARGSRPLIEMSASMINRDDPRHSQQRRLVSGRFAARAVRRHEGQVRAIAAELVAGAAARGTVEVVREIAAPLPAMVIGELLGFDRALWPKCMEWSERTMSAAGFRNDDPRQPAGSPEAIDGQPLDIGEIIQEGLLLLDGGAETTRSVIGQTIWNLARFPDQRQILLANLPVIGTTHADTQHAPDRDRQPPTARTAAERRRSGPAHVRCRQH